MPTNNLHLTVTPFRNESRVLKETDSLVRSGLVGRVYILALYEDGLQDLEEIDDKREVRRVRLRSRKWSRGLIGQGIKYLEFCIKAFLHGRKKNIKVINVHSLGLLPLGVFLKLIWRARLVYDAHELETETYGLRGLRQTVARCVERLLIKQADLVIVVGNAINEWYRNKYRISHVVSVLNCPKFQAPAKTRRLRDDLNIPDEKKIVLYQGGLIKGRGIEQLLDAFDTHDDKHVLVFMGYGNLESLIKKHINPRGNIYLKAAVDPAIVLQYTASADIGVSYIDNPSLNDHFCLPNKLFEYVMAGLTVIVNNAPEMRQFVNENQIGIVLNELTSQSLKSALYNLARMNGGDVSANIRRTAELYSWDNQATLMINAYKDYIFLKNKRI